MRSKDRHPFISLLYLLFFCLAGSLLFTVVALAVCWLAFGMDGLAGFTGGGYSSIWPMRIIQLFGSAGTFIFPALLFAKNEDSDYPGYLKLDKVPGLLIIVLSVLIIYSFSGFIDWTTQLNQKMSFPGFLRDLEQWMKDKEDQLEKLTLQLLVMKNGWELIFNILLIAIIPALGEELLFRGCIQRIFSKWTGNYQLGIWIAATIFSAIHVQFYGFLPRMLLGALFGYLMAWSGSLWVPIIAHFINNGTAVVAAYMMQRRGEPVDILEKTGNNPGYVPLLSVVFTSILLILFYKMSERQVKKNQHEK